MKCTFNKHCHKEGMCFYGICRCLGWFSGNGKYCKSKKHLLLNIMGLVQYIYVICRPGGPYSERPRAAFSRPRSQFFTMRTDPKPVNNFFFFFAQKNCFNFCKHKDKISRKRYRGPWADIGESCPR